MANLGELVKEHPVPAAIGGVVVFIIAYATFSRRGSSGAVAVPVQSGPSDAVLTAQIAATAQQNHDNAAAYAQSQGLQAQLAAIELETAAQTKVQLRALDSADLQTGAARDVSFQNISAQRDVALGQVQGQVDIAKFAADVNKEQIDRNADIAYTQLVTGRDTLLAQLDAEKSIFNTNAGLQEDLAHTAADVLNTKTITDARVTLAGYDLQGHVIDAQSHQNDLTAQTASHALDIYHDLGLSSIEADKQVQLGAQGTQQLAIEKNSIYEQNLVNLVGLGKNISGLPGVGITTQNIEAAQPGNTTGGILTGIGNLVSGVGRGLAGFIP